MVVGVASFLTEGVARKLFAVYRYIISATFLCVDAKAADCFQDNRHLLGKVVVAAGNQKGKIEVPQVMKNRTAARETTGKMPAVGFELLKPAFLPGVLVFADYNGAFILPEV